MLLPVHVAIGYLVGRKTGVDTRWCVIGSILPDLIDKSLGQFGVFPAYQTVSHSLFGLALVAVLVGSRPVNATAAFSVGWAVHLGSDLFQLALNGRAEHAVRMPFWPVLHWENAMVVDASTAYHEGVFAAVPFIQEGYVLHYITTPSFGVELAVLGYAAWMASSPLRNAITTPVAHRPEQQ